MVATRSTAGASSAKAKWDAINWHAARAVVYRLQSRITKAIKENRWGKVKALQHLLTHSQSAKLLAVKRVSGNTGSKTPGVDGVIWKTARDKMQAVTTLKRRGYQAQPLRRIYIPKKNGKLRPLGIPTMKCRAMQALYLTALTPISETTADKNSYGFRPYRSCADAIEQCFIALAKKQSAQWILEGDIKACFDKISHAWIEEHVPMDKVILNKWLKSGYIENKVFYTTKEGTPQGGVSSPTIANMVLDGLELHIKSVTDKSDKINFVRYADDFIVTGKSKEILEDKVKPAIEHFLSERGLELSPEKTTIVHIDKGFDFLGFNVRKYGGKMLIKPAKKNVLLFLANIRELIKTNGTAPTEVLIKQLNARIRGFVNYYQHVVSKRTFHWIDHTIFESIYRWATRRHPNKGKRWVRNKYFRSQNLRNWIFSTTVKDKLGQVKHLDLYQASGVPIKRHIKIRADANLFNASERAYFARRRSRLKDDLNNANNGNRRMPVLR